MSGHCDFCDMWHSGPCCHPGRVILAMQDEEIKDLKAKLEKYGKHLDHCNSTIEWKVSNCNCGFTTILEEKKQ